MKEFRIKITDLDYEKFKLESLIERKDIPTLIKERIFHRPFSDIVEEAFDNKMEKEFKKIMGEK